MDQSKLIAYLGIATLFLLAVGYKLVNNWIDNVGQKLDKIEGLETDHLLLKQEVVVLDKKVDAHITATNLRLDEIERNGRRTIGLQKKILTAVKNVGLRSADS
jgi:hypothetical protein